MAYIAPMMKLNDMYLGSPDLIDGFYNTCEKIIASGIEVIFAAESGQGRVINTIDDLESYRRSIELGVWAVLD